MAANVTIEAAVQDARLRASYHALAHALTTEIAEWKFQQRFEILNGCTEKFTPRSLVEISPSFPAVVGKRDSHSRS